jgi:hypothetical protein
MNFIETCNSDTRNHLGNMLNIWKQVQIIDLSTYVTYILKISEFQTEQEKSHTYTETHTHKMCWFADRYLVKKFLNFHLLNYKVEQMKSHWTPGQPGELHEFPQSEWEVFFQEFLWIPKQWIYSMSVK